MFSNQFIKEISQYERQICLVSGGYHSSVSALELNELGFENVILLNNRTYLEEPFSLAIMNQVAAITKYPLIRAKPNLKERPGMILRESFEKLRVEKVSTLMDKNNSYRDVIPCCRKLKKSPGKKWYKENKINFCKDVIISSLCAYEGGIFSNRWRRMKELRDWNTFLRFHTKIGSVWYAYPYRDYTSKRDELKFYRYLRDKGIMPEHSGCIVCPIRVARMIKRKKYYDCIDLRYYCKRNKLNLKDFGIFGNQISIDKFITEQKDLEREVSRS